MISKRVFPVCHRVQARHQSELPTAYCLLHPAYCFLRICRATSRWYILWLLFGGRLAIETEIKVRLTDIELVRRRLSSKECRLLSDRHFEDNYLLDFPDGRMNARLSLLRVRLAQGRAWVTYKGPPKAEGIFKTREELEMSVEDGSTAMRILENLEMRVWFRYQKYRQEFAFSAPGTAEEAVRVALDETPVGNYAEFEGSESGIRVAASAMGFEESSFLRGSYYSLYLHYCEERGEPPGHMVFRDEQAVKNIPI